MPEQKQPNVLLIMDDQHRHDFLGYAGADFVRTPNIDRIASRGVIFENCFCNSPVCAPSRIGLAGGIRPHNLGALDNQQFMPMSRRTYYQELRDHGYQVGCCGKLDLAKPDSYNGRHGDRPVCYAHGFTHPIEIEGKMHAGKFDTPRGPYGYYLQAKGLYDAFRADYKRRAREGWDISAHDSVLPTEDFADLYVGRRAVQWIESISQDFPWHFFVSFVGPHDPFDPPTEYADKYRDAAMPPAITDDLSGKPRWQRNRYRNPSQEKILETRRQYCASIEAIDDAVGKILNALERTGQADNTYIIFASDHGEMLGDHGMYTKSLTYESSWHVPLAVCGPGIAGGRRSDALIELFDLNPTICDLAGVPATRDIDACSFRPILDGDASEHRDCVLTTLRQFVAIRDRRYKCVDNYNDMTELYDLQSDPKELHNIADKHPDLVRKMLRRTRDLLMQRQHLR